MSQIEGISAAKSGAKGSSFRRTVSNAVCVSFLGTIFCRSAILVPLHNEPKSKQILYMAPLLNVATYHKSATVIIELIDEM